MIDYNDEKHIYYNKEKVIYDSPSKMLRRYKQRFPAKTAAKAFAKKFGKTPEYWLAQWKEKSTIALQRGNKIHANREEVSFGRGMERVGSKIRPVINGNLYKDKDLEDLPDGSYPELIVWNHGWKIAGRADKVVIETIDGVRYVDVYDFKSNKKIQKESWQDEQGRYRMMKTPISHVMDSSYWQYALQLSMYAYMMETHGFVPRHIEVIHIPHPVDLFGVSMQPEDTIYKMPYMKNEVLKMLEHYNRYRQINKYED